MTVQEKDNYIRDLVHKLIEKNHSEEIHKMFVDYIEAEDETKINQKNSEFMEERFGEIESSIGMKFKRGKERNEETEEHKDLLIAKLEQELSV